MTIFCTFVTTSHVFSVIALEDNEEGKNCYLCRCVEAKKNLDHLVIDGEVLEYHVGAVVVTDTWLRWYCMKSPNLWLFEDLQTKRKILHYSNLVVTSNVHLIKYGGKPHNKILWNVRKSDNEAILETLKCREDLVGSLDWFGRERKSDQLDPNTMLQPLPQDCPHDKVVIVIMCKWWYKFKS